MGQGLRIWDENGVNLVDTDYRMTQIIGSVYTADLLAGNAYVNGNIHVPEFENLAGTPFVLNIPTSHLFNTIGQGVGWQGYARNVRIENNFVKWEYNASNNQHYACWIIWGVY